ncbi:MAG TPA: transporter substrate-binding domain-containing protein [Ideonella sp.]|nr:transporter substrate-binding domain-containing protein [Ideonella sp.]
MRHLCRLLLLSALLAGPAAGLAGSRPDCSRPFTLALHDHGLLFSSQTGEGIDKDFAAELMRRSGCKLNITLMPRARIWQLIESGALDFSLSGISNEAREAYAAFAWYFSNKYYLLVRKDTGVQKLADFSTRAELKLGVIRSFRYSPTANRFVDQLDAQARVSYATQLEPLYEVLLDNRVQAMIIEPFDYPTLQSARIREQTQILEFDDPPVPHGLIMSKKALPAAQQQAWRDLVDEMRADGTVQRIFERYFKPELARTMTQF